MSKYFLIDGYWKDDKQPFCEYLVKEFDDATEDEDDNVFFYGLSEYDLKDAIQAGEDTILDFVITKYTTLIE